MNISLVEWPSQHPGKCVHCGCSTKNDGRKYVDMGLQIPRYGAVYFCEHCIRELGILFGLIDEREIQIRELELASAQGILSDVVEENHALRRALSELDFLGRNGPGTLADEQESENGSGIVPNTVVTDSEPEQPRAGRAKRPAPRKQENSGGSAESDDGEGSTGVLGDDVAAIRAERRKGISI